ncbi:MAG: DNA alkylation repair protein [Gaiellales bacterium]
MTPWAQVALEALVGALADRRDPVAAAQMRAYMRDQFVFAGVRSAERRALAQAVFATLPRPTGDDVLSFAEACWACDERELQYVATDLLRRHVRLLSAADLPRLERLVLAKSWWDTVDALAVAVGAIVRREPDARAVMDEWLASEDLWLVRVAILHQERWKLATDATWLFAACRAHAGHRDFFVRKAIGWALRSYAKVAPDAVQQLLDEQGERLSGLSRREAARGVSEGRRRRGEG